MNGTSIEELVKQSQAGDAQAFCRLVRHFERPALSLAYSITSDFAAAGDVVQDAFLNAWRNIASLRELTRFEPWLMQLVRNRAIDHRRTRSRAAKTQNIDAADNEIAASPYVMLSSEVNETRSRIEAAMGLLDELSRRVLSMRYFENCSSRQIGEAVNLSPAAVDMRLHRAREQLRSTLSDLVAP